MKNIWMPLTVLLLSPNLQAADNEKLLQSITSTIQKNPSQVFTYRKKGESREEARYVDIKKDSAGKPAFSVKYGGSYPTGTILSSLGAPLMMITKLFDDNPRLTYEARTVTIDFTDASGKPQFTVCTLTDYTLCGNATVDFCAQSEDGKGAGDKGYSVDTNLNFVYDKELNDQCAKRSKAVLDSKRAGGKDVPSGGGNKGLDSRNSSR